jgi:hypothetical protein
MTDCCIWLGVLFELNSSFYLETPLHVSGDTITHHQERIQLYLQHLVFVTLWVAYATHSTLKPVPTLQQKQRDKYQML